MSQNKWVKAQAICYAPYGQSNIVVFKHIPILDRLYVRYWTKYINIIIIIIQKTLSMNTAIVWK